MGYILIDLLVFLLTLATVGVALLYLLHNIRIITSAGCESIYALC